MTDPRYENYLNIDKDKREQYVYRIVSLKRLLELFEKNENVLVKPCLWDDPFENFIMNSKIRLPSGEISNLMSRELFYGQCWSKSKASDAMWRIYSPENTGIRIRTTVRKLFNSLGDVISTVPNVKVFIGNVEYLPNKKLLEFSQTVFLNVSLPQANDLARTLLVKRPAFKHENELRLLYFDVEKLNSGNIFKYMVNPHELIDQIMIDPRVSYSEYKNIKEYIQKNTDYGGSIKRSLLYTLPDSIVIPFGK